MSNIIDKQELLMRFVEKSNDYRKHLTAPIRQDGYLYATNGHIAIRFPDDPSIEASETKEVPTIARVFERGDVEFHPLPDLPAAVKCDSCNGSGKQYLEDCDDCDGEGSFEHGRHTYECQECAGEGKVRCASETCEPTTCFNCGGSGEATYLDGVEPIKVGGLHFQPHLLRMITGLPNARIEHVTPPDTTSLPAAHFVFDGGEGAVMPIKV